MQLIGRLPLLAVGGLLLGLGSSARAEDGGWSGVIEPRLNYSWETSTRVVVPAFRARVDSPGGLHVQGGYLLDAITSASIAQTGSDEDQKFTEYRQGADAVVSQDFSLGGTNELQLGLNGTYSTEDDYKSIAYGAHSVLTFNDKATRATLFVTHIEDDIRSNADAAFRGELSGTTLGASVEQALNPTMLLTLGYQLGYLEGYLGNAYRKVLKGPLPFREAPPRGRVRHTGMVHWAWFLPETMTSLHLLLSAYTDSWEIKAITPELRICQMIGDDLMVRPHYRFYRQSKAWFQLNGPYPATWNGAITSDPKSAAMTTHTIGITIEYQLAFLADTFLDFGKSARLDINFDRYLSTSRFGNGLIGSAGARVEF